MSVFEYPDLQMFCLKLDHFFHPLEVMGRSSETQLQVGENLSKIRRKWVNSNGGTVILIL